MTSSIPDVDPELVHLLPMAPMYFKTENISMITCQHSETGICMNCLIKQLEDERARSAKFYSELTEERRKVMLIKKKLMRILTI